MKKSLVEYPKFEDLHKEEIEFWLKKVDVQEVAEFCMRNRVEVVFGADLQHQCYINYKEGDGAYAVALTAFGALYQGIHEYTRQQQDKP